MRFFVPLLLLLSWAGVAAAHDFWLQPARFWTTARTPTPITMQVGHGADRAPWGVPSSRVLMLRDIGPNGAIDRLPAVRALPTAESVTLSFAEPGVRIIAMQSAPTPSQLPAVRFNEYLREEGLTPALTARTRTGRTTAPGRETYSRRAKTLVMVGRSAGPQPHVTRPLGMTLEIVPERDPYAAGRPTALPVRVVFEGRPLPGALVKLTNLQNDAKPVASLRTDAAGRAVFDVPRTGEWLLNVVWTKPIKGDPRADFQTTFSSLTFGYPAVPRNR